VGLLPKRLAAQSPALGLDIGSRMVKAILMDSSGGGLNIRAAGSFQVDEGLVEGGIIMDPPSFGRKLASHLKSWNITVASAVVSIPSSLAVLRWINLPALDGEDLRNAAKYKAKRHLPFSVDAAYVEASPVELAADGMSGNSLVIAVRREVVDSRAEAVEHAGLVPVVAELEAQATLRVVERRLNEQSVLWRDASLTIIDVGAVNTHMYVVQNQQLQFIRGIKFGGTRFAMALADQLNIGIEEAQEYLAQPQTCVTPEGILQIQAGDMSLRVNVQPEFEKLTREFLRLLRYFRSLHPERSYAGILDHMILCGGFTGLAGMAEYLEAQLELRVERAKPFTGMVGKFDEESFQSISNRQEAFVVAVGLALAGMGESSEHKREASGRREFIWARSA
jgi:type IV pilus assembly protein PilM